MIRRISLSLAALALVFAAAACGDDDGGSASRSASPAAETGDAFPVTVRDITLDEAPERIVSLTPTGTETLFAIGAGDLVVAADEYSTFPEEAPDTDLSGNEPNIEAIADYDPDLVVAARDAGDLVASLEALDIPVLLLPAAVDIDEVYEQIGELGAATGHADGADDVVTELRVEIDGIVEEVGDAGEGLTYYYELTPDHYSVTGATFIGQVLDLLGLESIADGADATASDYPQLSAEYIVDQDPDLVLLADTKCCAQNADTVAERPGWEDMQAIVKGGVVELDDDIASRWGPRIADLLADVADAVQVVAAA